MEESENVAFSIKIPKSLLEEIEIKIPKGMWSNFIRDAIAEKIHRIPFSERISKLEEKVSSLEEEIGDLKKTLAELDILTIEKDKADPYNYCQDEIDRKIVELIIQRGGATTPEISEYTGENRWLILNRLKKISAKSEKKLGKPVICFSATEKMGKRRAWWIDPALLG